MIVDIKNYFEIVDASGQKHRFDKNRYRWQFALKPGSIDELDKTCVEVYKLTDEDPGEEWACIFPSVVRVGDIHEE